MIGTTRIAPDRILGRAIIQKLGIGQTCKQYTMRLMENDNAGHRSIVILSNSRSSIAVENVDDR